MAKRRVEKRTTHTDSTALGRRPTGDAWANALMGLGTQRDRRSQTAVAVQLLSPQQCQALYRGDWAAAKVVDEPALEMTRRWLDVRVAGKKTVEEAIEKQLEDLEAQTLCETALAKMRWSGGSLMLLGCEDGAADISKPLNLKGLQRVRFLKVFDASEVWPYSFYTDAAAHEKYGEPEVYSVRASGTTAEFKVHESRTVRFQGIEISREQVRANRYWGDSIFIRLNEVLTDFGMVWGGSAHLLSDFSQVILRIQGLAAAIAAGDEALIRKRLENIEIGRSIVRATVLDGGDGDGDKGETWERSSTSVAGLPEMLDRFCTQFAAAADMPQSRLFGTGPGGLSKGDDSGERWWTERIHALQTKKLKPGVKTLLRALFACKQGPTKGIEPKNWSIEFRPLRELDPVQEADRRLKVAQADDVYLRNGAVLPEEVALSRWGGDGYSIELRLDKRSRGKYGEIASPDEEDEEEEDVDPDDVEPRPTKKRKPAKE